MQALVMEVAGSKENGPGAFSMKCSQLKASDKGVETTPVDIDPIYATDSLNDSWRADVSPVSGGLNEASLLENALAWFLKDATLFGHLW